MINSHQLPDPYSKYTESNYRSCTTWLRCPLHWILSEAYCVCICAFMKKGQYNCPSEFSAPIHTAYGHVYIPMYMYIIMLYYVKKSCYSNGLLWNGQTAPEHVSQMFMVWVTVKEHPQVHEKKLYTCTCTSSPTTAVVYCMEHYYLQRTHTYMYIIFCTHMSEFIQLLLNLCSSIVKYFYSESGHTQMLFQLSESTWCEVGGDITCAPGQLLGVLIRLFWKLCHV